MEYFCSCIDTQADIDTDQLFANYDKIIATDTIYTPTTIESLEASIASSPRSLSYLSMGKEVAVHSCGAVLAQYFKMLPQPIVPEDAQDRCVTEGYLSAIAARQVVSQTFRKGEIGVFMYVCLFIKDMAGGGGRDLSALCRFFAPLMFQKEGAAQSVGGYFMESFVGGDVSTRRTMFLQRFLE